MLVASPLRSFFKPINNSLYYNQIIINNIVFFYMGLTKEEQYEANIESGKAFLLWIARLGGGIGSWIWLKLFRHKTKHTRFRIIVPLWTLIWIAAVVFAVIKLG